MNDPHVILITGASSGIGAALARAYAAPGVHLALGGREAARLDAIAADCRARGATADPQICDVTDADAMATWIDAVNTARPLDLVIANAGISAGTGAGEGGGESTEQARRVMAVNVDGVMNTILPAITCMKRHGRGQVAVMSSLAGFLPLPGAPSYAESKRIVRQWGEGNRAPLARDRIAVNVICPGFVESGITAKNPFPMPFLMPANKAAAIIKQGLARNRARIAFPWPMVALTYFLKSLPRPILMAILNRAPEKPALD